jgi:dGTPase
MHAEPESDMRSCFQRDRDRIIHSTAFRRLEYKTQVFVNHEGDHYRTRLTHSLEVSQIARSLCRNLGLNEDLAEALALAHDLGHTPFGHAGEDGLAEAMQPFGGFSHNEQTFRIITQLESRYAEFNGLNLTWETLEGIVKHNGPLQSLGAQSVSTGPHAIGKDPVLLAWNASPQDLTTHASAEAQAAALSDDIAYHNHDIDDGLRAGLFKVEDLQAVPEIFAVFDAVKRGYPDITLNQHIHESIRRLIHMMCKDVLAQANANIQASNVQSVEDVRQLGKSLVDFSPEMQDINRRLKSFLMERMYRHYKVNRMSSKARRVTKALFEFFLAEPDCLPTDWRNQTDAAGTAKTARVVCDYIAGMTDRYALNAYHQIFEVEWFK